MLTLFLWGVGHSIAAPVPATKLAEPVAGKMTEAQIMAVMFTRTAVDSFLNDCEKKMKDGLGDGTKLNYEFYYLFAVQTKMWLNKAKKYPWEPEYSTRIAWSWYVDLYKTFIKMSKLRHFRERMEAKHLENSRKYKLAGRQFIASYNHFLALKKKPTKLTKTRYTELKRAKAIWEKKERAKAKAAAKAKKRRR